MRIVLNGRDLRVLVKDQELRNGKRRPGYSRPNTGSNTKAGKAWRSEQW